MLYYNLRVMKSMLIITLFFLHTLIQAQDKHPKIGLVLSGGGARGLAHIGVLKMIDSLQIPIDYVVGTSMGGIVGGLYAAGYSGNEIERYALQNDWNELFTDKPVRVDIPYLQKKDDGKFQIELGFDGITPVIPGGLIQGQNIILKFTDLTSAVASIKDFDRLPIPYRCVAVDLITGKEIILRNGSLARAMRATMAIPTVFTPVEWGDSLLIDGGLLNNFPADVARMMGADVIIGVNVGTPLREKKELESMISILGQTMVITDYARQVENSRLCDLVIRPDLGDYSLSNFDADRVREILDRGDRAAQINKPALLDIKTAYVYNFTGNFSPDTVSKPEKVISGISIPQTSSYTLEYFYQLLGYKPADTLDVIKLNDTVSRLRTSGIFDSLNVQITEQDQKSVNLILKIRERKKPVIYGVTITGNRKLPFRFINQLLGLKPGDQFDKQIIGERIRFMYGLGYFEEITYALDPVRDNYVRLRLNIKEKALRKLRLGFRYDDEYKLVGIITSQATNIPFAGLRGELSIQFAGLFKFDWIYYYPSRSLSTPIFPYIRVGYKNVPVNIFNLKSGKRIAQYDDISWTSAAGLGINIASMGILKFEYNHEYMDINPTIEGLDPVYFPFWEGDLRMLRSELALDRLDDPLMPTRGFKIDAEFNASLKKLDSDLEYYQYKAEASIYKTLVKRHIFRLNGFYTDFSGDLPLYKYPFKGGAESFVGVEINQIESNKFAYLRLDYIYKYRKDIYPKLIVNACSYNIRDYFDIYTLNKYLYGFGVGIKFLSIIGPFELIFSRGSKSVLEWDKFVTRIYFTAGYNF